MSLQSLVNTRYPQIKAEYPLEGRRKWILRVLSEYWSAGAFAPSDACVIADQFDITDDDPFDLDNVLGGVVIRTDYSDEAAWQSFHSRLLQEMKDSEFQVEPDSSDDDDDDDDEPSVLLKIINPEGEQDRTALSNISNLTALRLIDDVGLRVTPSPPAGTNRIVDKNPLIDFGGYQEIYEGLDVWIYDSKSNQDQSVRVVSQEGDVYGTATGDSWRCQVSHIYELQFNMTYMSMKINFGGLDRWDYQERCRNLEGAKLQQ